MEQGRYGRYQLQEKIASGGMGEVYAATHERMPRQAAIKILLPALSDNPAVVRRFFHEAQAAARIRHPGIVEVFDFGYTDDGRAYLVMEMLRGETLGQRLDHTPVLPLDQSVRIIRQLAGAIGAAHAEGIVHRDLKPDNIFLVPDPEVQDGERVKVLDFGLAKLAMYAGTSMATLSGSVFGTPAYMAPEQCTDSAAVDHRADLYSIGCIFYRCLCGRTPFGSGVDALVAHLGAPVIAPSEHAPDIARHIEAVILALLRKQPGQRTASCQALIDALDRSPGLHAAPTMLLNGLADGDVIGPLPEDDGADDGAGDSAGNHANDSAGEPPQRRSSLTMAGAGEILALPPPSPVRARRGRPPGATAALGALVAVTTLAAVLIPLVEPGDAPPDRTRTTRFDTYQIQAEQAMEARRWSEAALALEHALALDLADPVRIRGAVQLQERARREQQAQRPFARFRQALAGGDLDTVRRRYAAIPRSSIYYLEAELDYLELRGDHLERVRAQADGLIERGACDDLAARITEAERAFPGALAELADLPTRCTARARRPRAPRPRAARQRAAPQDTPAERQHALEHATRKSQYHRVLRLCARGVDDMPAPVEAATLCGMAACRTGKERLARQYHRTLPPARQSYVVQTCLEHGITFRDRRS